jgi:2-polyprenyl-3-methyl-5-hydroxy-6-metoxy-1,4-benzoquinol methylase
MIEQCPICYNHGYGLIYNAITNRQDVQVVSCQQCKLIYTRIGFEPANEELYSTNEYTLVDTRKSLFDKLLTFEYNKILRQIEKIQEKGRLLDFGSGKGKFLSVAKQRGWEVYGVETAKKRAAFAREIYGIEVSTDYYTSGKVFGGKFKVITLLHVLEHLPEPNKTLSALIEANLDKNGLLIIEVPNIKSFQASIAGKHWLHLDPLHHINHFKAEDLQSITTKLNLTTVKTKSYSFHLGVLGMADAFLKLVGYRRNIITDLKNKNHFIIKILIVLILPFAMLAEIAACLFNRGGIIRQYYIAES